MKLTFPLIKILLSIILYCISLFCLNLNIKLFFLLISYLIISYEIYLEAYKNLKNKEFFDENLLMILATLGAFIIKSYEEAVMVMLLYNIGEYLSDLAINNSKKSITKILDLRIDTITLEKNQKLSTTSIENAKIGDIFIVKPGEKIALDGKIIAGTSYLDTYPLTGEAIPQKVTIGSEVLSGCINRQSLLKVQATSTIHTTTATKIIKLLEEAEDKKSTTESFFKKFAKIYTPVIIFCALLVAIIPSILTKDYSTWIYRALVFLVTSCPCALVISIPLGYFCGLGAASKKGILIKGSNELDKIRSLDYLILDKTGTITKGVFKVTKVKSNILPEKKLVQLVASAEENSLHPIASAIKSYNKEKLLPVKNYQELSGQGITCTINNKKILIGNKYLMTKNNIKVAEINEIGTIIYVSINNTYTGYIVIADEIKESSQNLSSLKSFIKKDIIILSGDKNEVVSAVAKKLKIAKYKGELLPTDKIKYVQEYKKNGVTAFVGDGINDAPVIKISDIGISMGILGSDAAIETSDVILMKDDLMALKDAINISKLTNRKVLESIIFALIIKLLVLILALFGISTISLAVFADVGVTILSILNVLTIMLSNNKKELK